MEKKVLNYIQNNKMIKYGDSVILGVSGGADSLCLLYVLYKISEQMNLKLTTVHVNHHIRGAEADEDQAYVEQVCKNLGIELKVYHIDVKKAALESKCSEEEAGRNARYELFGRTMKETGADRIAVAHNLNDNSETILFNLFRGTGIKGLIGIPAVRSDIIRPLLCCTRSEIESYLNKEGVKFRTDSTNLDDEYTRNKIRLNLVPYIESNINGGAISNITNTGKDMEEIEDYLQEETKEAFNRHVMVEDDRYILSENVQNMHAVIKKRIIRCIIEKLAGRLKDITRIHIQMIIDLLGMEVGKRINLPYEIIAIKTYDGIKIYVEKEESAKHFKEEIVFENGRFYANKIVECEYEVMTKNVELVPNLLYTKWIDCDKIMNKLVVRKRQEGDFITVDDKGNTKKLKEYFINEKVARDERDNILLIADGSHIVWIIGYRISSYYKITDSTKNILKLTYKK